jgi:CBS domain-containing protein
MKLKDIMTGDVEIVSPADTLQTAARKMKERDIGFLPVCENDRLVGALTDRDLVIRAAAHGLDPRTAQVKDLVHSEVFWCFEDQSVDEGARLMEEHQIRRLIVIGRGDKRLVGVVSLGDLAKNGGQQVSGKVLQKVSEPAE